VAQSKPKSEAHPLDLVSVCFHISEDGAGLTVSAQPMWSTSGVSRLADPSARGIVLERMRDFLITLYPISSATPEQPIRSSKASPRGKSPTRSA
jgi:hypothetical protein